LTLFCAADRKIVGLFEKLNRIAKLTKIAFMVLVAIAICWRGTTFNDPIGSGVVPVLMCLGAGVSLTLLAFSMLATPSQTSTSTPTT
jgi:hypothetical protein